jgi:hypothetical protein
MISCLWFVFGLIVGYVVLLISLGFCKSAAQGDQMMREERLRRAISEAVHITEEELGEYVDVDIAHQSLQTLSSKRIHDILQEAVKDGYQW